METNYPAIGRPHAGRTLIVALFILRLALPCSAQGAWPPLGGDRPIRAIAENADIRKKLWGSLVSAPRTQAIAYKSSRQRNAWGQWAVSVERGKDAFYAIVSPEREAAFPIYAQGSWILKRSSIDGSFIQVKIFLRSDPGTFARIYPAGTRSRIDVVAYGGVLYREVPIPLSFDEILRSPFSRIIALTADVIAWDRFSPDPALYGDMRSLIASVRASLPGLRYADDGAIDADGSYVYIETLAKQADPPGLNCSGFAKWLVDGILHPITGSYLSVESLKRRMLDARGSSFTEAFEESLDPFFGLDWSRALAMAAWSAFYPSRQDDSPLLYDVTEPPFALRVRDADPVNGGSAYEAFADNFKDTGIDVKGLKAALFSLATSQPGKFYLAQFNSRDKEAPQLRRFFHIAALFPYFDDGGVFRVVVFESAAETSLDRILADRDYEYVKLIRMPTAARFESQSPVAP